MVDMVKTEQAFYTGSNCLTLKIWNEGKTDECEEFQLKKKLHGLKYLVSAECLSSLPRI